LQLENPRICIPICQSTLASMRSAIVQAADVADMIELRLDCLLPEELQRVDELQPLFDKLNLPLIVTLRPAGQGGTRKLDSETRNGSWFSWPQAPQVWRDMELDLVRRRSENLSQAEASQLICSYHDFAGTPEDVEHAYRRLAATPARVLKLATQAYDVMDCLPLFKLLEQARQDQREIIAIAMGPSGLATRILGPSRGAFLTFAAMDQESSTATGQLTVSELRDLYGIDRINLETQISGLIGFPIDHSVSPEIHNAALQRAEVNGVYLPFPVRDIDVDRFLKRMVHPSTREIDWNIRGLSVTAPHKSSIISSLDWIEPTAAELGAINTIVVEGNQLHGYNTDILGFVQTLVARFGELQGANCAVIGAGGAARAVVWGLKQASTNVTVFGRDEVQTKTLAQQLGVDRRSLTGATFHDFDVVINATNLGTAGELVSQTPASAEQLTGARLACDLVYNPQETLFLSEARAAGCETLGGLPMLVRQAAQQFKLWTGKDAPEQLMLQAAAAALQKSRSN
jgi:3-dehydroquinate dehydratase / shikimate dehydrogenase